MGYFENGFMHTIYPQYNSSFECEYIFHSLSQDEKIHPVVKMNVDGECLWVSVLN
jgi:hypothetical protein